MMVVVVVVVMESLHDANNETLDRLRTTAIIALVKRSERNGSCFRSEMRRIERRQRHCWVECDHRQYLISSCMVPEGFHYITSASLSLPTACPNQSFRKLSVASSKALVQYFCQVAWDMLCRRYACGRII